MSPHVRDRKVRVGIDVGGTFTHAVALDCDGFALVAKTKVPTTHHAPEGVARGIVQALSRLLDEGAIAPDRVALIAHSTTQATNALLEGDVAPVGVLGLGRGWLASAATRVPPIPLAPGKALVAQHRFLETRNAPTDEAIRRELEALVAAGARALVVSEAFAVDDPSLERRAVEIAAELGVPATAGSEVSQLYGLRARTRTAVLNAGMLPKMLESATLTERSVREAGITAPLMVMRSDGGVMDLAQVRKRPILTMLSGPAAGVAAAMMHARISDGVFVEVGGTSSDLCAIRNGKALVRTAEVGGHRLHLRTLDVRTVGVAGGSLVRGTGRGVVAVGPRSAHIAGLPYSTFAPESLAGGRIVSLAPRPGDPGDHLVVEVQDRRYALTPTCAANLLGLVPPGDPAEGSRDRAAEAFALLGAHLGMPAEQAADRVLARAVPGVEALVEVLAREHGLAEERAAGRLELTGGGGGAAAIVPYLGRHLQLPVQTAPDADVISAIGVALAMVRETVERSVIAPSQADLVAIRAEARLAVEAMGADPGTIEVQVEVDAQRHLVRASATGATALHTKDRAAVDAPEPERRGAAARTLALPPDALDVVARAGRFVVYAAPRDAGPQGGWRRFWPARRARAARPLRVVDAEAVVRLRSGCAVVLPCGAGQASDALAPWIEGLARYDDGGKSIPEVFGLVGNRILDFSGLGTADQLIALARTELEAYPTEEPVAFLANVR